MKVPSDFVKMLIPIKIQNPVQLMKDWYFKLHDYFSHSRGFLCIAHFKIIS